MLEYESETLKGLLIRPQETFIRLKNRTLADAYRYYVLLLIGYSLLTGVITITAAYISFSNMLLAVASIPALGHFLLPKAALFQGIYVTSGIFCAYLWAFLLLFIVFVKGGILHAFVILVGGEKGLDRTIQVVMYAFTPFFLLGWIPYLSIIGIIWSIALCIIGLRDFQDLPLWKAAAALLIPIILGITGMVLLLLLLLNILNTSSMLI